MKNPDSHAGDYFWGAVVVGTVAFDILSPETASNAMDRYLQHPTGKILAIGAVAITAFHLLNVFDHYHLEKYDPINGIGNGLGALGRVLGIQVR